MKRLRQAAVGLSGFKRRAFSLGRVAGSSPPALVKGTQPEATRIQDKQNLNCVTVVTECKTAQLLLLLF